MLRRYLAFHSFSKVAIEIVDKIKKRKKIDEEIRCLIASIGKKMIDCCFQYKRPSIIIQMAIRKLKNEKKKSKKTTSEF